METKLESKCCYKCGEEKPAEDFYDEPRNRSGLSSYCKPCHYAHSRMIVEKNRLRSLLYHRKSQAKKKGIPFTITFDEVEIPTHCPVLGFPLEHGGQGSGCFDNSPSIDRIVPELGYVPGNVAVISGLANRIKSNATAEQVEAVAAWMRKVGSN